MRSPASLSHAVAAACAGVVAVTGCAKMDAALSRQWVVVQLAPGTSLAAARHAARACSHVPNLRLLPVRPLTSGSHLVASVRYDATNASDADMARLQLCLQRFRAFQNLTVTQAGDS